VKILIVEDEQKVANFVRKGLQEEGYVVETAQDGQEGLELARDTATDLIILDVYLPKLDGFTVLKRLRDERIKTPVLLLTARADVEDKVAGLDLGADDYLTKPFAFKELLARVRVLLRRHSDTDTTIIRVADLVLDPIRRVVTRGAQRIDLTVKEFSLLEYLMRNTGRGLSRTMIVEHMWNYDFDSETNVVDVYINYLRKKIDQDRTVKLIHTVRGAGYVMKVE